MFQSIFSDYCIFHIFPSFEINAFSEAVLSTKFFYKLLFGLINALDKIAGNAKI